MNALDLPTPATIEQAVRERDGWVDSAAMFSRNADYYRGLLEQIGAMIGPEAYTSDDGSVQDSVLCIKLPDLIRARLSPQKDAPDAPQAD